MPDPLPQRILMTGDTVGGVWTFMLELARALGAHGVEVVLAAMGGEAAAPAIENVTVHTSNYKLEWMDDPWNDVERSGRWLLDLERRYRPDLIHLNTFGHGALPWNAPVVLTAHSCVLSWWTAVRKLPVAAQWDRYRTEVARSVQAADVLTAPSNAMLSAVRRHYGPWLPEARVVHNGRSAAHFHAAAKEPFILTAGRLWDEGKNVAAVARAAARIQWPVYLAGDIAAARFDGCHLLGRLAPEHLAGWYARAAIYALPARYEPFGLSALEAGLSGCALVLGDIESLRELWGDTALYVRPDDDAALAAALRTLIADPARRIELANRAAVRARRYTPEAMVEGYLYAYRTAAVKQRSTLCAS
jgi:glycogen(starch) synthase